MRRIVVAMWTTPPTLLKKKRKKKRKISGHFLQFWAVLFKFSVLKTPQSDFGVFDAFLSNLQFLFNVSVAPVGVINSHRFICVRPRR